MVCIYHPDVLLVFHLEHIQKLRAAQLDHRCNPVTGQDSCDQFELAKQLHYETQLVEP
jgi:hypothetical protein